MEELLNKFSLEDLEKLRIIGSLFQNKDESKLIRLGAFAEQYCALIKSNRSAAYHSSVKIALKYLTEYFGENKVMRDIEYQEYEDFVTCLKGKVKKGYRVYIKTIKAALNKGIKWRYLTVNHLRDITLPKKQELEPAFINKEQLGIICGFIKAVVIKDIIIVAIDTGMRLNELMNMRINDVDFASRIITVGSEIFETKGRNQRYIPISDDALEVLNRRKKIIEDATLAVKISRIKTNNIYDLMLLKKENELRTSISESLVFTKCNGKAYCSSYVSKCFKKACIKASKNEKNKIDKSIHFHSLRHSFASNLAQKGVPLISIKELLGHTSVSTTEIYSHLNIDTLRNAVEKLDTNIISNKNITHVENSKAKEMKIFSINKG